MPALAGLEWAIRHDPNRTSTAKKAEFLPSLDGQNFASVVGQIISKTPAILSPRKGRWPSSPNVGMGCGGRDGIVRAMGRQGGINSVSNPQDVLTSGAKAYGKVVWS